MVTYWDESNTGLVTERVHLPLLLAVQQAVVVLHADELGPAVLLGSELQHGELVGEHGRSTDVVHLATLNEIVQCLHRLLNWSRLVEAVNLQQVDVVGVETLEGCIHGAEDGAAGKS